MDTKAILLQLCASAPIKARNVLRKYDPAASFKDQKLALGAGKDGTVENLIETLKYLKAPNLRPNLNDYKKKVF